MFDNEAESMIFADYQIYSYRPRGFNTAELYLRVNGERLAPLALALLERMSVALGGRRFSIPAIRRWVASGA